MLSAAQIIKDCMDETQQALRVSFTQPNKPCGGNLDEDQIIRWVYIPALHALSFDSPVAGSGTYGTNLNRHQIIKHAFNKTTGKLRCVT